MVVCDQMHEHSEASHLLHAAQPVSLTVRDAAVDWFRDDLT